MTTPNDTPRTDGLWANGNTGEDELDALCRQLERELVEAEAEVERLRNALKSCWWATNTYDGNYTRACDDVAEIATNALASKKNAIPSSN